MLCIKQSFSDYERVWIVLEVFRLLVVYCWTRAIPQLWLVLLANHSFLLSLVRECADSFSFLFLLVGSDVILRGEAWESRRMGLVVAKTIVTLT
jgi:hypothetical protein